jgi:spore maturation protein CgeB
VRRILYTGRLNAWTTTEARVRALAELGHTVVPLDALPHLRRGPRLLAKAQLHLLAGPNIAAYNRALREAAARERPDLVWVDSGMFVQPKTLRRIREGTGAFLLHYHSDDIEHGRRWYRLYRAGLAFYDLHVTTNEHNIPLLCEMGAPKVVRGEFGYDPALHRPVKLAEADQARYGSDLTFIGHWEPTTEAFILALREAGFRVQVWGGGWYQARDRRLRATTAIYGEEYVKALAAAKICLCFLSKWNRNLSAGRTFEIPAIGRFLLAERTKDHKGYYIEGQEAEFFEGQDELLTNARVYMANAERREEIARAGHARCLASGYSHKDRVQQILEHI